MLRNSAQLLLLMTTSMGCLIPPDGKGNDLLGPYPPQVDLSKLFPRSAKTQLYTKCTRSLNLEATVSDLDSEHLLFRWVANNGVDNTKWLDDDDNTKPPGTPHVVIQALEHSLDFGFDPEVVGFFTGVVSLFVTDAPEWAVSRDVEPGERKNLGVIDNSSEQFSLIEVRWTFEYLQELNGVCDPDD